MCVAIYAILSAVLSHSEEMLVLFKKKKKIPSWVVYIFSWDFPYGLPQNCCIFSFSF